MIDHTRKNIQQYILPGMPWSVFYEGLWARECVASKHLTVLYIADGTKSSYEEAIVYYKKYQVMYRLLGWTTEANGADMYIDLIRSKYLGAQAENSEEDNDERCQQDDERHVEEYGLDATALFLGMNLALIF